MIDEEKQWQETQRQEHEWAEKKAKYDHDRFLNKVINGELVRNNPGITTEQMFSLFAQELLRVYNHIQILEEELNARTIR